MPPRSKVKQASSSKCRFFPCKRTFVSPKHYMNHLHEEHWDEYKAEKEKERAAKEATRLKGINERALKAAEEMERCQQALDEYYFDNTTREGFDDARASVFNPNANKPRPIKETFNWSTSRTIDLEDIQSDCEDEQPSTVPGTLPHIATRLKLHTRYMSDSDTDSSLTTEKSKSSQEEGDNESDGKSDEESDEANKRSGEKKVVEFLVTKRVVNRATGDQTFLGPVPKEKLLFDVSGVDRRRTAFAPFVSARDFKRARWLIRGRANDEMVTEGFNTGLLSDPGVKPSFSSVHTMQNLIDGMEPLLDEWKWKRGNAVFFSDRKNRDQPYFHRRLKHVIPQFFKQPAFKNYMIYQPEKHYNAKGERIYSDFYTGDFMNDEFEKLKDKRGSVLVPLIFASDGTQLSTHAGDHDLWPIYMTIANLPASLRSRPSTNSWILVATLPFPPKKDQNTKELDEEGNDQTTTKTAQDEKFQAYKDEVLHQVLEKILSELPKLYKNGILLNCADGMQRIGRPILGGWIADYQEYNKLCQIKQAGCAVCEIPFHQLGDNELGEVRNGFNDRRRFASLIEEREAKEGFDKQVKAFAGSRSKAALKVIAQRKEATQNVAALEKDIERRQLKVRDNFFWRLPQAGSSSLWKPDILHTLYEGMVKHVIEWSNNFLKHYGRLAEFEAAWLRIPAFQEMPASKKSLGHNKQMTGKLLRKAVRCLLPALVIALKDPPTPEIAEIFTRCLTCVRYLVDFTLIAQYKYHTEATMKYMDDYLEGFHKHKDVFADFRNEASRKRTGKKKAAQETLRLTREFARLRGFTITIDPELLEEAESADQESMDAMEAPLDTTDPTPLDTTDPTPLDPADPVTSTNTAPPTSAQADSQGQGSAPTSSGPASKPATTRKKRTQAHLATQKVSAKRTKKQKTDTQASVDLVSLLVDGGVPAPGTPAPLETTPTPTQKAPRAWDQEEWAKCPESVKVWIQAELNDTLLSNKEQKEIITVADFIKEKAKDSQKRAIEKGGHFNFIKIHLMSHFTETVRLFGSLEQFSTEIGETLHKLPKEAYRASNKHNHVPQILLYCTRKYAIRMRELNLVQLAKDGYWQADIQDVLQLYASREDKRQASKLGRDGNGSLLEHRLRLQKQTAQESDVESTGSEADDEEDEESERTEEKVQRTAEELAIRLPPLIPLFSEDVLADEYMHPLFSKPLDEQKGSRYFSGKVTGKKLTVNGLGDLFEAPFIVDKVRKHLIGRHKEYASLTVEEVGFLRVEVRTAVNIRSATVQSLEPFETLKAVCTGKGCIRRVPRNDSVLFRDDFSGAEFTTRPLSKSRSKKSRSKKLTRQEGTNFGPYGIANLLSLFRLKVPRQTELTQYRAGHGRMEEADFRYYRLAYVRVLKGVPAGPHGEMIPGPEVARLELLSPLTQVGYQILDIKALERPAHVVPEHSEDERDEKKMFWVFNNRIDLATWDMVYGGY